MKFTRTYICLFSIIQKKLSLISWHKGKGSKKTVQGSRKTDVKFMSRLLHVLPSFISNMHAFWMCKRDIMLKQGIMLVCRLIRGDKSKGELGARGWQDVFLAGSSTAFLHSGSSTAGSVFLPVPTLIHCTIRLPDQAHNRKWHKDAEFEQERRLKN